MVSSLAISKKTKTSVKSKAHLLFMFSEEEDKKKCLIKKLWVAAGQILAFENWRPDFRPGKYSSNTRWKREGSI